MKLLAVLASLVLASAQAQEPNDHYTLRGPEFAVAYWQLTLVSETEMVNIEPSSGFDFMSRRSCVREGLRRLEITLEADDAWTKAGLWIGFVCELTERQP